VGHATAAVLGRARQLVHLLRASGVPAIAGLDTRALARHLRETGCQRAIITAPGEVEPDDAIDQAREVPRWEDQDFVGQVSVAAPYESGDRGPLVAIVDYGLKANIVRSLRRRGARVRVLPHTADPADVLQADVSGVVLSPGPGDPARLDGPRRLAQAIIADGRPLLGICLGHQIVARAAGADTRRLRFGHHGANHPIEDLGSGRVQVTAQNHEVTVHAGSLPAGSGFQVSQRSLNDGSVEGLRHATLPIETVQYHPEGSPGPLDAAEVFDRFLERVRSVA
jgi:carbamoyl-phosphate synthase small subunit